LPAVLLPAVRLPAVRLPAVRLPAVRLPAVRLPVFGQVRSKMEALRPAARALVNGAEGSGFKTQLVLGIFQKHSLCSPSSK